MRINRRDVLLGLGGVMATAAMGRASAAFEEPVVRAVRDIVENIERARDKTPSDKILFVPMGEMHGSAVQKLVIQSVLQELKERGHKIGFGFEEQYDLLTDLTDPSGSPLPEIVYRLVDPDGQEVLRRLNHTPRIYDYADQSLKSLFNFCERQKISTSFNDLSRIEDPQTGNMILDPNDILGRDLIEALGLGVEGLLLDVRDPVAIALRNAAITFNAMDHATMAGAEIYIQHCGQGHLFGGPYVEFDRTLAQLFTSLGNNVLPVDLTGLPPLLPEAEAMMASGKALSVGYLPLDTYDYTKLDRKTGAVATLQRQERAYLENAVKNTKYVIYDQEPDGGAARSERVPGPTP